MKINVKSDCRGMEVNEVVEKILEDRGIEDEYRFLNPSVDDMLPLTDLKNVDEAWDIICHAINDYRNIALSWDPDLDGLTSGTIMYKYLSNFGANVTNFINDGKDHGLNKNDLDKYKQYDLLIIVDSLDNTIDNYKKVQENSNIKNVIVLDHHAINPDIPYDDYVTLISSQRDYGNTELSGAGVVWKFCKYADSIERTNYADNLVDLAGAGLVGDMSSMIAPENRYIVNECLKEIKNPTIKKIVGGFGWDSKAIAFSIAPLVNASMRMNKNQIAMDAFMTNDNTTLLADLRVLKKCKEAQNQEVQDLMADIEEQIKPQLDKKMLVVMIDTEHNVSGLVGNILLDKYKRPILIVKDTGTHYVGSMRAVGVDDFMGMINESGLGKAMGHELAAGVDIPKDNLSALIEYMELVLPDVGAYEETIDADVWVNACDIDRYYIDEIQKLNKISGTGFPSIRVYLSGIQGYHVTDMSQGKHLVIELPDTALKLIQWNFKGSWDEFEEDELFDFPLEAVVQLQSGWLGKNFWLQGIIDYIGVEDS